jgi:pilus assembly protein CpaF
MPVPPVSPAATPPPVVAPPPAIAPAAARDGAAAAAAAPLAPTPAPAPTPLDPKKLKVLELQREIHDRLAQQLELARLPIERLAEESLWQRAESVIVELVEQMDGAGQIPSFIDQDALIKDTLNETLGLGPLEDLLADDAVTAIFVNRHDRVLMERAGRSEHCDKIFSSELALKQVIDRLVAPIGRKAEGILDVRLPDGARLTAVLPPLATRGPTLALRKPRQGVVSVDDLVKAGVLSKAMADFLAVCTAARRNVVVCGGAGAAKAPLLSALAAACPPHERVVSVEETAELTLGRDAWIALEGSVADAEGKGGVGVAQLLAAARQLKPDRLVVGEVAGVEAWDLLLAMASACDGAFCAVAGEGPRAALASLETMARLGAGGATTRGVRELVAAGAHVIVHVARYADGAQRVTGISEVAGLRGDDFEIRDLFQFQPQGRGPDGVIRGRFVGLGNVPRFYDALEARGISADPSIFKA